MSYTPRLTAPDPTDLRYIKTTYGGYNRAKAIDTTTGLTLPNCTGYVHGRAMEILGTYVDPGFSIEDAFTYYGYTQDGFERTYEPQLGGIMCFATKESEGGPDPGHVCVVEEIIDADTVRTSDSNYGGPYFETPIRRRSWGWNRWSSGGKLVYQGCIIVYREGPTPPEPWTPTEEEMMALYAAIIRKKKRGEHL